MHYSMNNLSPITKNNLINAALFFCSLIISFLILEIAVRFIFPLPPGLPRFYNFLSSPKPNNEIGLTIFDKELGWVINSNSFDRGQFDEYISTDSMGFRNNDNKIKIKDRPAILAMGDSFTFGIEVDNTDSWPSQLEFKSGIKVLNGGVQGYGLDQMLTRTKSLLKKRNDIDIIIVAFITEDIQRVTQKKQYGLFKPYYTIENSKLILNKVNETNYLGSDCFKKIFGFSYAVHLIMSKIFKDYWLDVAKDPIQYANIDEFAVSRKIIDEFSNIAKSTKSKYIIFALLPMSYDDLSLSSHPLTDYIRDISKENNSIFLLDIQTLLFKKRKEMRNKILFNDRAKGYHGHFSKKGNEFVAQEMLSFLQSIKAY
jgi:lysophospholipase L1-like esterase